MSIFESEQPVGLLMMMLIYDLLEDIQKDKRQKDKKWQKRQKRQKKAKKKFSLPALCCTCHFHSDALCGGVKLAKISNHPHKRLLAA